jgi:hypothetical protein
VEIRPFIEVHFTICQPEYLVDLLVLQSHTAPAMQRKQKTPACDPTKPNPTTDRSLDNRTTIVRYPSSEFAWQLMPPH